MSYESIRKKINVEQAKEYLQDAISLIIILENDLSTLDPDEIHLRTVKIIHEILKKILHGLST